MKKKTEYQVKIQVRVNMRLTFFVEVSFATIGEIHQIFGHSEHKKLDLKDYQTEISRVLWITRASKSDIIHQTLIKLRIFYKTNCFTKMHLPALYFQ